MRRIETKAAIHNLMKNVPLFLSTGAALCHYLAPSLVSVLMLGVLFVSVFVAALFGKAKPDAVHSKGLKLLRVILTLLLSFIGFEIFNTTWKFSSKVDALAEVIGLTGMRLVMLVGLAGCVAGFYALYVLAGHIIDLAPKVLKKLPVQDREKVVSNLKSNLCFLLSAVAFFGLSANLTFGHFAGMLIAVAILMVIASQVESVWSMVKQLPIGIKIYSALASVGICFGMLSSYFDNIRLGITLLSKNVFIILVCVGWVLAAIGLFFAYVCVCAFCKELKRIVTETGLLKGVTVLEYVVYAGIAFATLYLVVFAFTKTNAFYGTSYEFDVIYTSDSSVLVTRNVYLSLMDKENDLRQPLFAVFAAPFVAIPNLVSALFKNEPALRAILLNSVQVIMLVAANFMLSRAMKLDAIKRICFVLLASGTYTSLLFSLMMEQYIVAYFWLAFCIYLTCEKKRPDKLALYGAGGTLITSMVFLLTMSDKSPFARFKEWLSDMVKYGVEFVLLMLAFCRFDVIMNLTIKASSLSGFTDVKLSIAQKVFQYTEFIHNLFLPPNAGEGVALEGHISWQLNEITSINLLGVAIFAIVLISAFINRKNTSSIIAICWVGFSAVMLVGLGWGTAENGLILYSLYFGWAFLVLLFQLVEKLESKLKVRFVLPIISLAVAVFIAYKNIPAILKMIDFAITHFPIYEVLI